VKQLIYWLLIALLSAGFAACFTAIFDRVARTTRLRFRLLLAACVAAAFAGGMLPSRFGMGPDVSAVTSGCLVVVSGLWVEKLIFVWWKRRTRVRGKQLSTFWTAVDDDYPWEVRRRRRAGTDGAPTELVAGEAPTGRGTEPAASQAVDTADADGVRHGVREHHG